MCSIKFTDAVRTFDGNGDFGTWCRKFEASASICGVEKLGAIPLLLEGSAFELYAELHYKNKKTTMRSRRHYQLHSDRTQDLLMTNSEIESFDKASQLTSLWRRFGGSWHSYYKGNILKKILLSKLF